MGQPEYRVGRFRLQPRRQLTQDGVRVQIGRKALDLLSALAEAEGELVTKEELVEKVWPQTFVDDNALQVQIATARKVLGEDAKLLSTVRGLGYRLDASDLPVPPATTSPNYRRANPKVSLRRVIWGCVSLLGLAGLTVGALALMEARRDNSVRGMFVAVAPFQPHSQERAVREFSNGLSQKVSSALSTDHIEVTSVLPTPSHRWGAILDHRKAMPDLQVEGAVWQTGSTYDVYAHLDDPRRGLVIWSNEFRSPSSPSDAALQTSIASRIAEAVYWANVGRSGPVKLDPPALAAFIAGREGTTGISNSAAVAANYQKVTSLFPNFSWGHSAIAAEDGFRLLSHSMDADSDFLRAHGQSEARRALDLDRHNGEAYLALELLTPRTQWKARETFLLKGAASDRLFGPVALMEGRLLQASGRLTAANTWLELAHDLSPLHNGATDTLVLNDFARGRKLEGRTLLDQMRLDWPDHSATRNAEFWSNLMLGKIANTLTILNDPKTRPEEMDQTAVEAWRSTLQGVMSGNQKLKHLAIKNIQGAVNSESLNHGEAAVLLTMLDDLDNSFEQAQQYALGEPSDPPYLFLSLTKPMRMDRRFMTVARNLGLIAYWRSTGDWPDFCREPSLPYDCRAEAAKAEL